MGSIWTVEPSVSALNTLHERTAVAALGIEVTEIGDDFICGTMPVDERTIQPFGLLHGGAAVLLLETLASAAANHCVDPETSMCVGLEINCNHVRGMRSGLVTGTARCLHRGRTAMVWEVCNHDAEGKLVTTGRMTSVVVVR